MRDGVPLCLVVDDSAADRLMMTRVLSRHVPQPRIVTAATLAETRMALAGHEVSILFLDNMLPDGVGADFLSELKTRDGCRDLPVVMVSDWPSPFMRDKARAARVLAVWTKNEFTFERTRRIVKSHARPH
ncbi:MAG: response regulator [Pseudooceanicola sp.]